MANLLLRGKGLVDTGWFWEPYKLSVSHERIEIRTLLSGTFTFLPDQVIKIEIVSVGFISKGVRIYHNVPEYPEVISLSASYRPSLKKQILKLGLCFYPIFPGEISNKLIKEFKKTGFTPSADPITLVSRDKNPIRWPTFTFLVFMFFFSIGMLTGLISGDPGLGIFTCVFTLLIVIGCMGTEQSSWFHNLVFKPKRYLSEMKGLLLFLVVACCFIFATPLLFPETRNYQFQKTWMKVFDEKMDTPLHKAVLEGDLEYVEHIISLGADLDAQNKDGLTPLHLATMRRNAPLVYIFLIKDANTNIADMDAWTPLHFAAKSGQNHIIEMLISRKANVNAKTKDGKTALDIAISNSNEKTRKLLEQLAQ